jgi:hypothetical protein
MAPTEITLTMPVELGAQVMSKPAVEEAVKAAKGVRVQATAPDRRADGTFEDASAVLLMIMATPAAAAAIKGIFDLLRTVITEAHRTRREEAAHRHDLRKVLLTIGATRTEIDLREDLSQVQRRVDELEALTANA